MFFFFSNSNLGGPKPSAFTAEPLVLTFRLSEWLYYFVHLLSSLFYEPEDFYTPVESLFPPGVKAESNTDAVKDDTSEAKAEPEQPAVVANHGGISVARGWQVRVTGGFFLHWE